MIAHDGYDSFNDFKEIEYETFLVEDVARSSNLSETGLGL